MSFFDKIDKVKQLDTLIRLKSTGNCKTLASKLGISESSLFLLLQTAKDFGADIIYNPHRNSYEYVTPMRFKFGFEKLAEAELDKLGGGIAHIRAYKQRSFAFL
jgi:hypothetical protein